MKMPRVNALVCKTGNKIFVFKTLQIPKGTQKDKIYKYLPYDKKFELAGFVFNNGIHFLKGNKHRMPCLPDCPAGSELTFHTHPLDVLSIPSEADITTMIAGHSKKHILVTEESIIIFDIPQSRLIKIFRSAISTWKVRTASEYDSLVKTSLQRYIFGTKGIKVKITNKNWENNWQKITKEYIGIKVKIIPRSPLE